MRLQITRNTTQTRRWILATFVGAWALIQAPTVVATDVPFTEDFVADSADWYDSVGARPMDWSGSGGPDGGSYAVGPFNFVDSSGGDTPLFARAQDEFGSSGGAFEGDWIADGVTRLSAFVRQETPIPLTFFVRFTGPRNFPGAVALIFTPVPSDTWTEIAVAIHPDNPQFIYEGSDFESVFSNIGHVQVGVIVPEALAGHDEDFDFDLDKVTIVPEPSTALLTLAAAALLGLRRHRAVRS